MKITGDIKQKPEMETGDLIRYNNELYIVGFIDKPRKMTLNLGLSIV